MIDRQLETLAIPCWDVRQRRKHRPSLLSLVGSDGRASLRQSVFASAKRQPSSSELEEYTQSYIAPPRADNGVYEDNELHIRDAFLHSPADPKDFTIEIYTLMTDHGPDVHGAKRRILGAVEEINTVWVLEADCILHQYHIMEGTSLHAYDELLLPSLYVDPKTDWSYYASVASFAHVLRGNANEVYYAYKKENPDHIVQSGLAAMCPQPLTKRWGRHLAVTDYLLRLDQDTMSKVLREVLQHRDYFRAEFEEHMAEHMAGAHGDADRGGKGRGRGRAGRGRGRGGGRRRCDEEDREHNAKYGKWARIAIKVSEDTRFWLFVATANRISHVLGHLAFAMDMTRENGSLKNMALLVTEYASTIRLELENF